MPAEVDRQLRNARNLYNQGKALHLDGNYVEAANQYQEALKIQEVFLGKYHQETIKTYWRSGRASCLARDDEAALRSFHRAARMAESTFNESINRSLREEIRACWDQVHEAGDSRLEQMAEVFAMEQQGDANTKNKNFTKAAECYSRALSIQKALVGEGSLDGADIQCKLACCYLRMSKLDEANVALSSAHDCFLAHFGELHPATLGARASLKTVKDRSLSFHKEPSEKKGWFSTSMSSFGSAGRRAAAHPSTAQA